MQQKKILIIDDDPAIVDSLRAILENSGYRVITGLTSEEGLSAFKKYYPDFVLCDMMMESIDEGISILKNIRMTDRTTPVFLLSSIGDAALDNINIEEIGFNGVFQKPVNLDHMLSVIGNLLK